MGLYQSELEVVFDAARPLVWAIVADTNRWDRAAGLAPPVYEWMKEGGKNLRLAKASEMGVPLEWIEPPYRWVEGRHVEGERRFRAGPVSRGGFKVTLEDMPGGKTKAKAVAWVEAPMVIGVMQKLKFGRALTSYFHEVSAMLEPAAKAGVDVKVARSDEPAVTQARRILLRSYSALASGPRTSTDERALEVRAKSLRARPVDPKLTERLLDHIRTRADEDVSSMKPFELARLWNVPRRDVLKAFLYATEAGLTDLVWQVNCPTCRVGARMADSLSKLGDNEHCGACEIDYTIDFARHLEAVFPVSAGVRKVEPKLYCASSPAFLPHVFAQVRADKGARVEHDVDLPLGQILVRTLWLKQSQELEHTERPARLEVVVSPAGMRVSTEGTAPAGGPTRVVLVNETNDEVAVLMERTSWSADAVLGTVVTSMPEFATLFATEAPASGVELRVGHIALLFSDLTGSTALYERVGDAKAFAIVEDHFRLMGAVIEKHGGGVIKTMGDAVMASFPTLAEAVAAGLDMVDAHDAKLGALDLGVKIGVHAGPCLVVRANDRLDYFGTTVNVAARLQAQAGASQVVLTELAAADPAIVPLLEGVARTQFEARLKGIRDEQRLLAVQRERAAAPDGS
ncbi:MAG: adenylate/guanylate cyclase domain-containing protein [Deltaproteobacteria bacterium]|nr:adenylate/guanylate cyclase domain-containing protein [Deltaproteobacteria bacterium]